MKLITSLMIMLIFSFSVNGLSLEYTKNSIESYQSNLKNENQRSVLGFEDSNNISTYNTNVRNLEKRYILNTSFNSSINSSKTRLELIENQYALNSSNSSNNIDSPNLKIKISNITRPITEKRLEDFYQEIIEEIDLEDFNVHFGTFENNTWNRLVYFMDRPLFYPFESTITSYNIPSKQFILIKGVGIEGDIAALRELYLNKGYYMRSSQAKLIRSIEVFDFLHDPMNEPYFNTDTPEFRQILKKAVFGKFDVMNYTVVTSDNISLRIKQFDSLVSDKIKDHHNVSSAPVVFAGGLWSDIDCWKELASEMSDSGYDSYLIEITGGPGQDCENCINYDFDDLTDSFWPSLIGAVQVLNNNTQVYYIGHSNGARTAISSLEKYNEIGKNNTGTITINNKKINVSMTPHPIEKMVAAGVPGSFEGQSYLPHNIIKSRSDEINVKIILNNLTHIDSNTLTKFGLTFLKEYVDNSNNKISVSLWNNYSYWIEANNDKQIGDINLNKFLIIKGIKYIKHDGIVTVQDENEIFNKINSTNKIMKSLFIKHQGMPTNSKIKKLIKDLILN